MSNRKKNISSSLIGKGMYVALAICLAGAGTAAWVTINSRISPPESPFTETPQVQQSQPQENIDRSLSAKEPEPQTITPVEQKQPDVSKEESTATEKSSVSSSSGSSSEAAVESTPVSRPQPQSEKSSTASFTMPLNTQVVAPFSGDKLVENTTLKEWRTHNGIDLKAAEGDSVRSACDGKVTAISFDPLWGTTVEITAEDYVLTYCGLREELPVKLNDHIAMGETVGTIDTIPCEAKSGSHLHFTVKHNNEYIDPLSLLSE